jgi:LPS export ABC transporter protein LptC
MFSLKRILGVLILMSIIALGIVVLKHQLQRSPEQLIELLPKDVDLALQDLHYTQNEDGRRSWTLDAEKAEYLKDQSTAYLETVRLVYYQTKSFGDVHLQADQGELYQQAGELDVWGNVVLTSANQQQFFTEQLHYSDEKRQLSTDSDVRIVTPRLQLTGTGMQIDVDRGYLLVKKQVRATILPETFDKVN